MAVEFNIEARWPELFAPLDESGRMAVVNAFASSWHEGGVPNREDLQPGRVGRDAREVESSVDAVGT